jgi:hypothetical protein
MAYTIRNALLKDVEQIIVKAGVVGSSTNPTARSRMCMQGVMVEGKNLFSPLRIVLPMSEKRSILWF